MVTRKALSRLVETYKFWEIVTQWAKERLEHEDVVARALRRAVICEGLPLNSVDERWVPGSGDGPSLRGYPYVGYCPVADGEVMMLRAEALEHLLRIVREAVVPCRERLANEFIRRKDFEQ